MMDRAKERSSLGLRTTVPCGPGPCCQSYWSGYDDADARWHALRETLTERAESADDERDRPVMGCDSFAAGRASALRGALATMQRMELEQQGCGE